MNKLYRSRRDKKISGLCGGLAEWLNVDATLIRVVVIITAIFSTGFPVILIYIIASAVIPKEPGPYDPPSGPYNGSPYNGPVGGSSWNGGQPSGGRDFYGTPTYAEKKPEPQKDQLDEMMKEVEKKALQKEIEELKAKLNQYEKGDV